MSNELEHNPYYKAELKPVTDKIFKVTIQPRNYGKTIELISFYERYIQNNRAIATAFPHLREEIEKGIAQAEKIIKDLKERFTYHDSDPITTEGVPIE